MQKNKPPAIKEGAPFTAFGVRVLMGDIELLSGLATPRKHTARISRDLDPAYGYRSTVELADLARSPQEAWERALQRTDSEIERAQTALKALMAQREALALKRDEAARAAAPKQEG